MLKIAKVKSEKEFYKKYPSEEAFMKAHGKAFKKAAMGAKMVNDQLHQLTDFGNPPKFQGGGAVNPNTGMFQMPMSGKSVSQFDTMAAGYGSTPPPEGFGNVKGGGFDAAGAGMAALGALPAVIGGIQAIGAQRKAKKKAQQNAELSGLSLQAQQTMEKPKNQYVRPEDSLVQPGQLGNPYGTGTNYLAAQNGTMIGGNPTEIQNTYAPTGDLYRDLGYEPLEESVYKQYRRGGNMPKAEFGEYFQDSGEAQIGGAVGEAAGTALFGPLGGMAGKLLGQVGGNLLGGAKNARELQAQKDKTAMNQSQMGFMQNRSQGPLNVNVKNGGWVSHDWQPQTFTKFGEYSAKDLLKPPHDADMLRAGGHIAQVGYTAPSAEALYTGRPDMPQAQLGLIMGPINKGLIDTVQNSEQANKLKQAISSGMMNYGGKMALGGELQIGEGGYAETLSYNPNLPGGEIGMFRGASHDNGGIQTQYGENGVEVEGNEPFTKLKDGGSQENLVVFGNMKINKNIADLMGDPKAKDKKFKTYVADVAKNDAKQLKTIQKGLDLIEEYKENSPYDKLGMNSGMANLMGGKAWQKINADKIKEAGIVQDAIHQTARQLGAKSDKLAEGKIEKETDPRMVAQGGTKMGKYEEYEEAMNNLGDYNVEELAPSSSMVGDNSIVGDISSGLSDDSSGFGNILNTLGKGIDKYGPTLLSNLAPFLRPSNANEDLPADQLYPEYYAMATNQLEPVKAQKFQPMLETPYNISLNDQLNAIDSQSRAIMRQVGNNPGVLANIAGQTLEAKNKVLGETNRINQANAMAAYDRNRNRLDDAQKLNLQILDNQYVRQAQAKSNTKAQTQAILSSISAKTAQQRATNRKLAIMENMYGFRFSPSGRAINANAPAQFNMSGDGLANRGQLAPGYEDIFNAAQQRIGSRKVGRAATSIADDLDLGKSGKKIKARNSSIIKALKNL